jgi:hypothetical protein
LWLGALAALRDGQNGSSVATARDVLVDGGAIERGMGPQYHGGMPLVEILDGPSEWAGAVFESPEDMVADEIGLTHPRWRGTPVLVGWGALYTYRKVEVAADRHRYRYVGPFGGSTPPSLRRDGGSDRLGRAGGPAGAAF